MCQCVLYTTKYKNELAEKVKELESENELISQLNLTYHGEVCRLDYASEYTEINIIETFAHVASDIVQKTGILQTAEEYLSQRKDLIFADKEEIKRRFIANNYLAKQEGFSAITYYLIYIPILTDLKLSEELNIDGWLRFRIGQYKSVLVELLEQFIEDYFIKKDIIKFINMIKEINHLSAPLEEVLHLVYTKTGRMKLLNKAMQEVTAYYMHKYCDELLSDQSLSKEDLMMNIFITVCPGKIVIHQKEKAQHPEFIDTLESIFGINIEHCKGCEYCRVSINRIK